MRPQATPPIFGNDARARTKPAVNNAPPTTWAAWRGGVFRKSGPTPHRRDDVQNARHSHNPDIGSCAHIVLKQAAVPDAGERGPAGRPVT